MWLFARADFMAQNLTLHVAKCQTAHCSWELGPDHVKAMDSGLGPDHVKSMDSDVLNSFLLLCKEPWKGFVLWDLAGSGLLACVLAIPLLHSAGAK